MKSLGSTVEVNAPGCLLISWSDFSQFRIRQILSIRLIRVLAFDYLRVLVPSVFIPFLS